MPAKLKNIGLFFLLPVVILYAGCRIADFNGLYGQDAHEYLRYAKALALYFHRGVPPGDYFWPLNYPMYGAALSLFIQNVALALQLISMAAFAGSAFFLLLILQLLFNAEKKNVRIYIILFYLLSPYMLRFSVLLMSDMLAVFFISGAYYYYLKFARQSKYIYIVPFFFFAASAVMTRYAAFIVFWPAIVHCLVLIFRQRRIAYVIPAVAVAAICFLPHFLLRGQYPGGFLAHPWLVQWSPLNLFKNDFITADGHEHFAVINIIAALANIAWPSFLFAGILFISFSRRRDFASAEYKVIALGALLYILFIAGIPFQNMRFLLMDFPLIILLFYPAFSRVSAWLQKPAIYTGAIALVVLLQLVFCFKAMTYVYVQSRLERNMAAYLELQPSRFIYTLGMEGALANYLTGSKIESLYGKLLKEIHRPAFILIEEKTLLAQYEGKEPARNWAYINKSYPVVHLKSFPHGWELYGVR